MGHFGGNLDARGWYLNEHPDVEKTGLGFVDNLINIMIAQCGKSLFSRRAATREAAIVEHMTKKRNMSKFYETASEK